MKVIIDRFEGEYAVCEKENREMIDIEKNKLPAHAKEGDVLIIKEDSIKLDKKTTAQRRKEREEEMDDLWQ